MKLKLSIKLPLTAKEIDNRAISLDLHQAFRRFQQVTKMVSTKQASLKKVAILIENQFEDFLFQVPYQALQKAGAKVSIIGSRMNEEYHYCCG